MAEKETKNEPKELIEATPEEIEKIEAEVMDVVEEVEKPSAPEEKSDEKSKSGFKNKLISLIKVSFFSSMLFWLRNSSFTALNNLRQRIISWLSGGRKINWKLGCLSRE